MKRLATTLGAALLTALIASPGRASVVYQTAVGSDDDGSIQGQATITLGNNQVTITLENLDVPGTGSSGGSGAGVFISGILLTLHTSTDFTGASFDTTPKGTAVSIASNGTFTRTANTNLTTGAYSWGVDTSGKTIELAAAGNGSQGGQPNGLIIGPTGFDMSGNPIYTTGTYDVANGNLHSPVQGPVTFVVDLTGATVTSSTVIDLVKIEFGTGPDKKLTASQVTQSQAVPEPTTIAGALLGLGTLGLGALMRRRRSSRAA
jgi:MYXO-CTERM domain-containing protein